MKKKLTLLIYLLPVLLMAQTGISNNGTITFDFGKKKKQQADTVQPQQQPPANGEEEVAPAAKKQKVSKPVPVAVKKVEEKQESPDFRKDGLFKGLFNIGISASQLDADADEGFNKPGLEAGLGVMVRFHKFLSVSMQMEYSQKGAKQAFIFSDAPQTLQQYRVQLDYITVPVSLNVYAASVHANELLMINLGLAPGVLVRFKERDSQGEDITNLTEQPHAFDLEAFGGLYFIIHKHYMLGGKYSASIFKIRGPDTHTTYVSAAAGEFNHAITLSFTYILSAIKKK